MTFRTIGRELLGYVIRISSLCEIIIVTTIARIGCIIVIAIMTGRTVVGNGSVSPQQLIEVIVNGESRRRPSRVSGMTGFAGNRQIERNVIRIDTLVVVRLVTGSTGIRRIVEVTLVTIVTGN